MCLCACPRCKARLLRASKSAALVKTAQQHATKLEGILAVVYEAHTNFQTSFSLAVAASMQQQQQSSTGQQGPWAPSRNRLCSSMQQQGSMPPGSCPGRLQQGSCSSPGVALAPRFVTACGAVTSSQEQQQNEVCTVQAAVQGAVQQRSCAGQPTVISHDQQASSNAAVHDGISATAGTETAASLLLQTPQPGLIDDPVAAALDCMPDYQRAWALLKQVLWSIQRRQQQPCCACCGCGLLPANMQPCPGTNLEIAQRMPAACPFMKRTTCIWC
jgi:hypothetical protein